MISAQFFLHLYAHAQDVKCQWMLIFVDFMLYIKKTTIKKEEKEKIFKKHQSIEECSHKRENCHDK